MARTRASINVTVWADADWRALPFAAKYLYWLILAQSKINLAGCIDLMIPRWADMSPDTDEDDVRAILALLESRRFVAIDWDTSELVVRTFVKHDVGINRNSLRGMWSSWEGIMSPYLRHVVVANIPAAVWEKGDVEAPAEAVRLRHEQVPDHPIEQPIKHPFPERVSERVSGQVIEQPIEPPIPSPSPSPTTSTTAVLDRAALQLGLAEAERRGGAIGSPAGYARSRAPEYRATHEAKWVAYLDQHPTATADELVALVLRPPRPALRPVDHTELTAAAALARYEVTQERLRGAACEACGGSCIVETEAGCVQCPACTDLRSAG